MGIFGRKATGPDKAEVEGEIFKLVSRDLADPLRPRVDDGETVANNLTLLMQRVSLDSVQEIDELIGDLKALRDRLHRDSNRLAHEIVDYASLGPVASESTKIIAEYLSYWKRVPDAPPLSE